jgi:16S rRNA (cytidine1402-2'-O)-methyltransferase
MLSDVYDILGDRKIALAKEMTKVYEDVGRGPISRILSSLKDTEIRGEYTIIVQGLR